jgi:hypothetical protein
MSRKRRAVTGGKPTLYVSEILRWADEFHERAGHWPTRDSGRITGGLGLTWIAVDNALRVGLRGLPKGDSLAKLLARHRGHRHRLLTPRLTANGILAWADAHRRRTGAWPTRSSGPVAEASGETWSGIDRALHTATRGLRFPTSLAALLAKRRGRMSQADRPPLTEEQILAWAQAYRVLYGAWPSKHSGAVGNRGETWARLDNALRLGLRGLPGGSSLSLFLKAHARRPPSGAQA